MSVSGVSKNAKNTTRFGVDPLLDEELANKRYVDSVTLGTPIAEYTASISEASHAFTFSPAVDWNLVSQVTVIGTGVAISGGGSLRGIVEAVASSYIQEGVTSLNGTITGIDIGAGTVWELVRSTLFNGSQNFTFEWQIRRLRETTGTSFWSNAVCATRGFQSSGGNSVTARASADELTGLTITAGWSWNTGTQFFVYTTKRS